MKIAAAAETMRSRETELAAARTAASPAVAARAASLANDTRDEVATLLRNSIGAATAAYYPFEESAEVPDDKLRNMTSVLTIVGGKVVHDAGVLKPL